MHYSGVKLLRFTKQVRNNTKTLTLSTYNFLHLSYY